MMTKDIKKLEIPEMLKDEDMKQSHSAHVSVSKEGHRSGIT